MIWRKIKMLFKKSFCYAVYYNVRSFSLIRLFFDFDYTSRLWGNSLVRRLTTKAMKRIFPELPLKAPEKSQSVFALLMALCPFLGLWGGSGVHIILLAVLLAIYFLTVSNNENIRLVLFYEAVLTAVFMPVIPFSVLLYIIYVETGIFLFFGVKYSSDFLYEKYLCFTAILWFCSAILRPEENTAGLVAFMPYALIFYKKGKLRRYFYSAVVLSLGVYTLARGGGAGLVGGGISVLTMLIFGDIGLIFPLVLTAPWIVGLGIRVIKGGVLSENIIRTGLFFWRYGFKGVSLDYNAINSGYGYGKIISGIFAVGIFVFFWYVLRISRLGIKRIFEKNGKNKTLLRAGIGAIVGFSVYTFFAKGQNSPANIMLYLWSGGLLKRASDEK